MPDLLVLLSKERVIPNALKREFENELRSRIGFAGLKPIWRMFVS